jgi:hypothetical protein
VSSVLALVLVSSWLQFELFYHGQSSSSVAVSVFTLVLVLAGALCGAVNGGDGIVASGAYCVVVLRGFGHAWGVGDEFGGRSWWDWSSLEVVSSVVVVERLAEPQVAVLVIRGHGLALWVSVVCRFERGRRGVWVGARGMGKHLRG